jgi:general secretion pathway protein B
MSFILDALKKSETERQRQNAPSFAEVPDATDPQRAPRWLWVLGALLAINLIALFGVMLRPELQTATPVIIPVEPKPTTAEPVRESSFSEIVEQAKKQNPRQMANPVQEEVALNKPVASSNRTPSAILPARATDSYLTFNELRANGTLLLPDLHLDIHVYSDKPAERFVFVNMSKYRERARLAEGPMVKEITPEGVILEHLGNGFLLPRE